MLTKKIILPLFCLLACHADAQDSLLLRDYTTVKTADRWLTAPNAAALTRLSSPTIVHAEASLTKANGGLVDYNGSNNTLEATVGIESFYRLNDRVVAFGAISYDNWSGRNMTGSAFIPRTSGVALRLPFDIVEDSLTNAGRKHLDTYRLSGGFGVDVYRGLSLGARLDYTSANYAKYKDLRHKNKLMDLQFALGVYAPVTEWLSLGADYGYHRQTESVDFGTYGKSEKIYKSLIDYGAFMGRVEQFGNEGFTDKSREMPLFEESHGGLFQLELSPHRAGLVPLAFYGSLAFSHGTGYYGRRSPYTVTLTNHRRDILEAQGRISYYEGSSRFYLDASYRRETVDNNAETYRELRNDLGANYYEYFDAVETGDKRWQDVSLAATALLGINGELPTWSLMFGWQWMERRQRAYLFPYYRSQLLSSNGLFLDASRNILLRRGVLTAGLQLGWQNGSGEPSQDGTFLAVSDQQETLSTMEAFLMREYQYLVASQYIIGANVKYAFIFPGTRLKTHIRLAASHRTTSHDNPYAVGNRNTQATVAVGCTF